MLILEMCVQESPDLSCKIQDYGFSGLVDKWHKHVASPDPRPDYIESLLAPASRFLPPVHPQSHMIHPTHQPLLYMEASPASAPGQPRSSHTIAPLEESARPALFPPPRMYNSTNRIFLDRL